MTDKLEKELSKLSPEDQLRIAEELRAKVLRDNPDLTPITGQQRAELDRRLRRYRDNPHPGIPAEEVHAELRAKLRQ